MLSVAISCSDDVDVQNAVELVISDCRRQLGGAAPQAGILFTSLMDADFSAMLSQINTAFPGIELIGCTTDGEIISGHRFIQDSVSLLLFGGEGIHFASSVALRVAGEFNGSVSSAFQDCEDRLGAVPTLSIVLPDGLSTIGTSLDSAIQAATGNRYPVFGGTAGDHFRLTGTYQFHGQNVYSDALPVLMMGGNLEVTSEIRYGVRPIGQRYEITSFDKNIVHTIEHEPAYAFFERHLGPRAMDMGAGQCPLAIYPGDGGVYYLRDPLNFDEGSGAVSFIGNFEEKSWARLTVTSREEILQSADQANNGILAANGNAEPELLLIFSCTTRRHILGSRTVEEVALLEDDGREIPFFGFYCYGEIGPVREDGPTLFHNDTYIVVGISSKELLS